MTDTANLHPPGRRFWVEPGMIGRDAKGQPRPSYTVSEAAKFFFGKSASWLRMRMRETPHRPNSWLVLDGKTMQIRRKVEDKDDSARVFALDDIEPAAWSMHGFDQDDLLQARRELEQKQAQKLAALKARQAAIMANVGEHARNRPRMIAAHENQLAKQEAKHAQQLATWDAQSEALRAQLAATIQLVVNTATLYGILGPGGDPPPHD